MRFFTFNFVRFFLWLLGNKRKQIFQVAQNLDERLKELDEEKEELRKYQQLDKQRKSLEYTIYDKELHDARQKLVEVSCYGTLDWNGPYCYFSCYGSLYFIFLFMGQPVGTN